jgi:cytoplasmic iron level regulating protein YaaA (DUF328/UPF0246 family)
MKIVISPAKSLNFESDLPTQNFSEASFLKESRQINGVLKKLKPNDLSKLMDISDKLAELNWERNQSWKTPFTPDNSRPAIYAFDGEVYTGIHAYSLPIDKMEDLQNRLFILSGLYGLLKPLDLIQAYRLEMGTSIAIGESKNLYAFWKTKITETLNKSISKGDFLLNLASNEYFSAVDTKLLKAKVITPEFKDYKDGKLKMISFFAKKARGLMVRYIIDTNAQTIDDIQGFNYEGYAFDANLSTEVKLVFTR